MLPVRCLRLGCDVGLLILPQRHHAVDIALLLWPDILRQGPKLQVQIDDLVGIVGTCGIFTTHFESVWPFSIQNWPTPMVGEISSTPSTISSRARRTRMLASTRRRSAVHPPYGASGVSSTIQAPYSGCHEQRPISLTSSSSVPCLFSRSWILVAFSERYTSRFAASSFRMQCTTSHQFSTGHTA